ADLLVLSLRISAILSTMLPGCPSSSCLSGGQYDLSFRYPCTMSTDLPSIRNNLCRTSLIKCQTDRHCMKDFRITVRFPAELHRRLKAAARRSGTRESDLVRTAVQRQLAAQEDLLTAYDRARNAKLIGLVQGADRDLST